MSFTEWILTSLLPLPSEPDEIVGEDGLIIEDEEKERIYSPWHVQRPRTVKDFVTLSIKVRTVIQFSQVCDYFMRNQMNEEVTEAFFHSRVLPKTLSSALKILRRSSRPGSPGHIQQGPHDCLDERIVEIIKILTALIHSLTDSMTINQLFSNYTLSDFIRGIFDALSVVNSLHLLSESAEFHLLVKTIALKMSSDNLDLFIRDDGSSSGTMEFFSIICRIPSSSDYHISITQRNIVLIIAKLLVVSHCTNWLDDIKFFMLSNLFQSNLYPSDDLPQLIDDLYYCKDILDICRHGSSNDIVDFFYESLIGSSSESQFRLLAALSTDIVFYFNSTKFHLLFERTKHQNSLLDVFLHISLLQNVISNCQDQHVLKELNLMRSKDLRKFTILSDLLSSSSNLDSGSSSSIPLSNSPMVERRYYSNPLARKQLSGLGPLDPTGETSVDSQSTFTKLASTRGNNSNVTAPDARIENSSIVNKDEIRNSNRASISESMKTPYTTPNHRRYVSQDSAQSFSAILRRKGSFDFTADPPDNIYERETVQRLISICTRQLNFAVVSGDERLQELLLVLHYACLKCIGELVGENIKFLHLLSEDHRAQLQSMRSNVESTGVDTSLILLDELDKQFPLFKQYRTLSFSQFISDSWISIKRLERFSCEETAIENSTPSILWEIFL